MGRIKVTQELTDYLWEYTNKLGVFRCPEVTIGRERVDLLTYTSRLREWRCYEVKSCKEDFYSEAAWTFVGHYNYFVMSEELFKEVKEDIPDYVGVIDGSRSLKRAKRRELGVDDERLRWCLMRSLSTQLDSKEETIRNLKWELRCLRERVGV